MPGTRRRRLSVLLVGAVALMAVGCATKGDIDKVNQKIDHLGPNSVDQQARDDIKKIKDYLGTSPGGGVNKPLLPVLDDNFNYLRTVISQMQCAIETLQNHGTKPTPCPTGGGSESPTTTPKYPS